MNEFLSKMQKNRAYLFIRRHLGSIAKILVSAGPDEIKCGQPILVTIEEGEDAAPFSDFTLDDAPGSAAPAPAAEPEVSPKLVDESATA